MGGLAKCTITCLRLLGYRMREEIGVDSGIV